MIKDIVHPDALEKIVTHLAWENKKMSKMFVQILKDALDRSMAEQYTFHFRLITALLKLQDSLFEWRVDALMASIILVMEDSIMKRDDGDIYTSHVEKLAADFPAVKIWLLTHKEFIREPLSKLGWYISS